MVYIFNSRTGADSKYARGVINGTQQWAKMESAGAVFLPGTGVRTPIIMASVFNGRDYGINNFGNYWTSTRGVNYGGYSVGFFLDELFLSLCDFNSKDGRAVRLAKVND